MVSLERAQWTKPLGTQQSISCTKVTAFGTEEVRESSGKLAGSAEGYGALMHMSGDAGVAVPLSPRRQNDGLDESSLTPENKRTVI